MLTSCGPGWVVLASAGACNLGQALWWTLVELSVLFLFLATSS